MRIGLGEYCDSSGACYDDSGNPIDALPLQLPSSTGLPPVPSAPSSGSPGFSPLTNILTNAAGAVISRATMTSPQYVTNPYTGQSVLYNPNTGQLIGATGAVGITNPTVQSLVSYIPLALVALVAAAFLGKR